MRKIDRYVIDYSLKNGLGHPSISLYLKGCDKPTKCEDCHNYELQIKSKRECDIEKLKDDIDKYIDNYLLFHKKLYFSILGGEPLTIYNRDIVLEISKYVKEKYPESIIVLYSWRTMDNIRKGKILSYTKYIDYGVLGSYEKDLYVENILPSSSNQYIYNFNTKKRVNPIKLKRG